VKPTEGHLCESQWCGDARWYAAVRAVSIAKLASEILPPAVCVARGCQGAREKNADIEAHERMTAAHGQWNSRVVGLTGA
jgi:hypothetical protein